MIRQIIWIVLLTFIPGLELRWSIPIAILGLKFTIPIINYTIQLQPTNFIIVFFTAVISNIILGIIIYEFLYKIIDYTTKKNVFIRRIYENYIIRIQKRVEEKIKKYEWIGLALFIAIPLPGSGVYSGAIVSQIIGVERKDYYKATILGVTIAGIIVTILTITGKMIL